MISLYIDLYRGHCVDGQSDSFLGGNDLIRFEKTSRSYTSEGRDRSKVFLYIFESGRMRLALRSIGLRKDYVDSDHQRA